MEDGSVQIEKPQRWVVYRALDKDGQPLYIGQSKTLFKRLGQHATKSLWWRYVVRFEYDTFAFGFQAIEEERRQIALYAPPYNGLGKLAPYYHSMRLVDGMPV